MNVTTVGYQLKVLKMIICFIPILVVDNLI